MNLFLGCAMSGLIADSKTMIDRARVEAQVVKAVIKIKYLLIFIISNKLLIKNSFKRYLFNIT